MRQLVENKDDIRDFTKSNYCYHYQELPTQVGMSEISAYCSKMKNKFAPIAKEFSDKENGLWLVRHYLAIKYIMAASILSGAGIYSQQRNVLVGIPYFNYYSLLNCCRAFLMTAPDIVWRGQATVVEKHSVILNTTSNLMRRLDKQAEGRWGDKLRLAREHRELYSYRFPTSGFGLVQQQILDPHDAASLARLIAELAVLNTECLEASLAKHSSGQFGAPHFDDQDWAFCYKVAGIVEVDSDDKYRFSKYLSAKWKVSTLEVMATDGLVEDFFGAWYNKADIDGNFNPDDYMGHLLLI